MILTSVVKLRIYLAVFKINKNLVDFNDTSLWILDSNRDPSSVNFIKTLEVFNIKSDW